MLRACVLLLALAAVPATAQTTAHWTCIDATGKTVATDQPCPEGSTLVPAGARVKATLASVQQKPDWRSQGIPVWIWPVVGILGLLWIKTLLPEKLFRKAPADATPAARQPPVVFVPPPKRAPVSPTSAVSVAPPSPAAAPAAARIVGWTPEMIDGLSLNRLETLVQRFWQARSCEVTRARGADGGIELLISRPATGKLFALAQCAATRGEKIGIATVKALAATGLQKATGIVVLYGLTGFTDEALAFAKDKPVKLLNASGLLAEIRLLPVGEQQRLLERTLIEAGPAVARS